MRAKEKNQKRPHSTELGKSSVRERFYQASLKTSVAG